MTDNTPIITKWRSQFDWTIADTTDTKILSGITSPATIFLSAKSHGIKGNVPGARHTWVTSFNVSWLTTEVTDIKTITHLNGNIQYALYNEQNISQVIISDRISSKKWFNNKPRIDYITNYVDLTDIVKSYPCNKDINLIKNNCNTFISYIAWKLKIKYPYRYIGYKPTTFWESLIDN